MTDLARAASWHRHAAALLIAAERAGLGETEWAGVRARLLTQRATFAEIIAGLATPLPTLTPTPSEISAAGPGLGDLSANALMAAVAAASAALDQTEAALRGVKASPEVRTPPSPPTTFLAPSGPTRPAEAIAPSTGPALSPPAPPPTTSPAGSGSAATMDSTSASSEGWPALRNALVYGGYSLMVLVVQVALFLTLDEQTLPLLSPLCLVVLPALAWSASWITIGMAFRRLPGGLAAGRSPRLGAVICLAPNLLACLGIGILFLAQAQ